MTGRYCKVILTTAVLLGLTVGCQPAGSMRLTQPQLQGWQRELKLETEDVRWAGVGDAKVERVLAVFPLPGARTGQPTYLLYLRLPAGESNVSFAPEAASGGRGFFVQIRGEYAGLARLTGGTVEVRGDSQGHAARRRIKLDLTLEDGSHITGEIRAKRDEYAVSRFESRQHPADVQSLLKVPTAAASQPRE